MRRDQGQLSLSDSLVPGDLGSNVRLDRIDGLIDWPAVEAVAAPVYASPTGPPRLSGSGHDQSGVIAALVWLVGPGS